MSRLIVLVEIDEEVAIVSDGQQEYLHIGRIFTSQEEIDEYFRGHELETTTRYIVDIDEGTTERVF